MNDFIKKNLNVLIIVLIVISFNLIAHTLWGSYFCTAGTVKVPDVNNSVEKWNTGTILTGVQPVARTIVSTKPVVRKNRTSEETNKTDEGWAKPLLGWVSAGYDGETEYERVRNQLIKLWLTYDQAETIVWEWYANTSWGKQFVRNIVWVSNSEGGIFEHGLYNNYLGVMYKGSLRHYATFALAIEHWRQLYNKNKWYLNTEWQDWLDRHYCVGDCSYWVQNYNAGIRLLGI